MKMYKFETYFDMNKVNMAEVKEFIFKGDTYELIPYTSTSTDSVNKMLESFSDKRLAQEIKEFIEIDNARFPGIEMAFHCLEKQSILHLYCEEGFVKNFWWSNELALAE